MRARALCALALAAVAAASVRAQDVDALVGGLLRVSWDAAPGAGDVTFTVQALQPAGCVQRSALRAAPRPKTRAWHGTVTHPSLSRVPSCHVVVRSAAALGFGVGMGGSTAYVGWWDEAAGQGRVVRLAPPWLLTPRRGLLRAPE